MHTVLGIFPTPQQAARAAQSLNLPDDRMGVVAPAPRQQEDADIGQALGGVLGGSLGLAIGSSVGTAAAASLMIPGVGPIVATGTIAALLLGAGGVALGTRAGKKLDQRNAADPAHDPFDQFFYHDALRRGRAILLAVADDRQQADRMQATLASLGAKGLDAAREDWWSRIREGERAAYEGDFAADESEYQKGFEAALEPARRAQPLDDTAEVSVAYRKGYERGYDYFCKLYEQ